MSLPPSVPPNVLANAPPCLVLFTDFGLVGPYVGQMQAALHRDAPGVVVINLFADAPAYDARAAAYLLASYAPDMPRNAVFVCVVDPGVGGDRPAMVLYADDKIYVGPGNGLFEIIARRAGTYKATRIIWRPAHLSPSFHGRDLFAPVAAALARGEGVETAGLTADVDDGAWCRPDWSDDLAQVIYLDHYGNAMTGLRAATLTPDQAVVVGGHVLGRARTFGDVTPGQAFWYENANGLVEIAVNQGSAVNKLNLTLGSDIALP